MKRFLGALVIAITFALVAASTASAGGWSTATVDDRPEGVQAGDEFRIAFTVRQHGMSPMDGLEPTVTFINEASGERVVSDATPTGVAGQYAATAVLPEDGTWTWKIDAFGVHAMAPFDVGAGDVAGTSSVMADLGSHSLALALLVIAAMSTLAAAGIAAASHLWNRRPLRPRTTEHAGM